MGVAFPRSSSCELKLPPPMKKLTTFVPAGAVQLSGTVPLTEAMFVGSTTWECRPWQP